MALVRWNPVGQLAGMEIDRLNRMFSELYQDSVNREWTPAVDVYACGVVADELLPEDRGAELREIVGRCLREDPNERFSDARSLGEQPRPTLTFISAQAAVVRRIKSQAGTKQLPAGATASWPNPADAARRRHSLRVRVVAIVAALALVAAALTVALGSDGGSDSPTKAVGAKQPPRPTAVPRSDDPAQQARELADFLRAQLR